MGCVQSTGIDDEAKARTYFSQLLMKKTNCSIILSGNDEIESQLKHDRMMAKNDIKMLLFGAGESGKVGGVALPALKVKIMLTFSF